MKLWDGIAAVGLFVGAVILAADAALKSTPTVCSKMPAFVGGPVWSFLPLVLVRLAAII
jgi:hypothetical protein